MKLHKTERWGLPWEIRTFVLPQPPTFRCLAPTMSRAKDRRPLDAGGAGPGARCGARGWRALCIAVTVCVLLATAFTLAGGAQNSGSVKTRAGAMSVLRSSGLRARSGDALVNDTSSSDALSPPQSELAVDETQPATEVFEMPAPAPLAAAVAEEPPVVEGLSPAPAQLQPAVAFLFLTIDGAVTWPEIWAEFFAGAADPSQFNVYIHRSQADDDEDAVLSPAALAFLAAARGRANSVPTAANTAWGQLIAAERSLAREALTAPENVAFVYVSATTLPVKSFADVYETLASRASSRFCLTTQQTWVRSRVDADAVYPKTAQWMSLSREHAERFADEQRGDAVALVNQACGGSWRQCYPATSEELVMAAIVGPVPASAMGSDWLAAHPPPRGGPDNALVTALLLEAAAQVDDGSAANATLAFAGVNNGSIPVRDVGATNQGACDTWHWWDDFPSDAKREPAFEPLQLLADSVRASGDASASTDMETILEQHVDRFWSPPWHPQELRGGGMTERFLLDGLCASKSLFARKFSADFTLRPAPLPRDADGDWDCPADEWKAAPHERLDGVSCDGMRHAPILGLGLHECRQLCCSMGRDRCNAWQYRGRWSNYHFCWLGREAGHCSDYGEAKAQLWRGERLLPDPPALPQNASAVARQQVVDAFARCFQQRRGAEAPVAATEPAESPMGAPVSADAAAAEPAAGDAMPADAADAESAAGDAVPADDTVPSVEDAAPAEDTMPVLEDAAPAEDALPVPEEAAAEASELRTAQDSWGEGEPDDTSINEETPQMP